MKCQQNVYQKIIYKRFLCEIIYMSKNKSSFFKSWTDSCRNKVWSIMHEFNKKNSRTL